MGKSITEWKQTISKLSNEELRKQNNALKDLCGIKSFMKEFSWVGLEIISTLTRDEVNHRVAKELIKEVA